jgi:flagellar operon protein
MARDAVVSNAVRINNYQRPVDLLKIAERKEQPTSATGKVNDASFKEMFSRELAGDRNVTFSKHASERLFSRGIQLGPEKLNRLADAIDKAAAKGSKETLVLTDEAALVVSVKNRTVITAFDRDNLKDGVVTSIDSAVII